MGGSVFHRKGLVEGQISHLASSIKSGSTSVFGRRPPAHGLRERSAMGQAIDGPSLRTAPAADRDP
jgi:hypothetical protein